MSRIANYPITVPKGAECKIDDGKVSVKGPKDQLSLALPPGVTVTEGDDGRLLCKADKSDNVKFAGTARSLIANMLHGVTEGYERKLQLVGVGYRAQVQGRKVNLSVGFSHPAEFDLPEGITAEAPSVTELIIKGANNQLVGQTAAKIRGLRPPEPYKGKGIRYADERIIRKEAKKA